MKKFTADILIFGYGEITRHLIHKFTADGLRVICVSDQDLNIQVPLFAQLRRSEIIRMKVESNILLVCWKDEFKLFEFEGEFYRWMIESLCVTQSCYILSSASIYKDSPMPLAESEQNLDLNYRDNPKYRLEQEILNVTQKMNVNSCILRISNVYGKDIKYGLIGSILNSINSGVSAKIYTGATLIRDYLFVNDLYDALYKLINSKNQEKILNLSSGIGLNPDQVLEQFLTQRFKVKFNRIETSPVIYKECSILDNGRARRAIEWIPKPLDLNIRYLR